jgi:uncharacterized protein (TIGR00730 family)
LTDIRSICAFCGAANGNDPAYRQSAARLGGLIAAAGIRLVFGGGNAGLMGALADGAIGAGGDVVGVIPYYLVEREHAHPGVARMHIVDSMHSRKQRMFELSDAFVVLPGGVGTLDETFEIVTWKQLGMHDKPIVVVDVAGYWQRLDALVAAAVEHGFAAPPTRQLYTVVPGVNDVLPTLERLPRDRVHTDPARL